jgi:hypothetical protein
METFFLCFTVVCPFSELTLMAFAGEISGINVIFWLWISLKQHKIFFYYCNFIIDVIFLIEAFKMSLKIVISLSAFENWNEHGFSFLMCNNKVRKDKVELLILTFPFYSPGQYFASLVSVESHLSKSIKFNTFLANKN